MSRPLRFTQADVRRALKGAAEAGVTASVELRPDGVILLTPCIATAPAAEFDVMRRIAEMKL